MNDGKKGTQLLDYLGSGVCIIDISKKIRYWNRASVIMTGYDVREVLGKNYNSNEDTWLLDKDFKNLPIIKSLESGKYSSKVYQIQNKSGNKRFVKSVATPIKGSNHDTIGAIEIFYDMSSEVEALSNHKKLQNVLKSHISSASWETLVNSIKSNKPVIPVKKYSTIMFIDLLNFSTMSEKLLPEEVIDMLNLFFGKVQKTILSFDGDIDKFIGDSMLITFLNAESASRCATEILLVDIPIINSLISKYKVTELKVHIGINTGWVIVGNIGTTIRRETTVIGDVVNTAARIQQVAPPDEIWVSGMTLAQLGNFKKLFQPVDYKKVKGKIKNIMIYKFTPGHVTIDNKVFCYEKNEILGKKIKDALTKMGVTKVTTVDNIKNIQEALTPDHDLMVVGPSVSVRELAKVVEITNSKGLAKEFIIPVPSDVNPETVTALEQIGIKTYVPWQEEKGPESLHNVIARHQISKIPRKGDKNETDKEEDIINSEEVQLIIEETGDDENLEQSKIVELENLPKGVSLNIDENYVKILIGNMLNDEETQLLAKKIYHIKGYQLRKQNVTYEIDITNLKHDENFKDSAIRKLFTEINKLFKDTDEVNLISFIVKVFVGFDLENVDTILHKYVFKIEIVTVEL